MGDYRMKTFYTINDAVREADEATCEHLLMAEKQGLRRKVPMLRIHARFNKLRGQRERRELIELAKKS